MAAAEVEWMLIYFSLCFEVYKNVAEHTNTTLRRYEYHHQTFMLGRPDCLLWAVIVLLLLLSSPSSFTFVFHP